MIARSPCMAASYSAANFKVSRRASIIRRMSWTHLAHCGRLWQWLNTWAGRWPPWSMAVWTSRSRMPLQLQTYTEVLFRPDLAPDVASTNNIATHSHLKRRDQSTRGAGLGRLFIGVGRTNPGVVLCRFFGFEAFGE